MLEDKEEQIMYFPKVDRALCKEGSERADGEQGKSSNLAREACLILGEDAWQALNAVYEG